MKQNKYLFLSLIALVVIVAVIYVTINYQKYQSKEYAYGPFKGFLFQVDNTYYFVQWLGNNVFSEEELIRQTGLSTIYPPIIASQPTVKHDEAKNIANSIFNEAVKEAKANLENFDLQKCIADCENSGRNMGEKTCEQYCNTDYKSGLQSFYDNISESELISPILVYNETGGPLYWEVLALNENQIVRYYDLDVNSGAWIYGGGDKGIWTSENKAKEIIIDYLSKKGISYNKISEGRYILYKRIVL